MIELKDGDIVYCSQHDGVFLWRDDPEYKGQMCRCRTDRWRVVANVGPIPPGVRDDSV